MLDVENNDEYTQPDFCTVQETNTTHSMSGRDFPFYEEITKWL